MTAGSLLPVAIHKNKLYFLFGKENDLADTPGWSDFGGGVENGETPYDTALREGGEEMTGFLGDNHLLKKYKIIHKILWNKYHLHVILMDYDENLPTYFNNNHDFLWSRMNHKLLNDTKLFEKKQIKWFSVKDIKVNRSKFREFYQNIIDILLKDMSIISKKLQTKISKSRTRYIRSTQQKKSFTVKQRYIKGG